MNHAAAPPAATGQRAVIRDYAIHLFGQRGYTGTSMRDIANAVGVLPGSLYAHIDSKEALLVEIVEDGIGHFIERIAACARGGGTPLERLQQMIIAHVEVVAENPERSLVVFHQWRFLNEENLPLAIKRRREYERYFVEVVEQGIADNTLKSDINPRIAVLTILGAVNWTPEWFSPTGPRTAREVGDMMAGTLLSGIVR